MTNQQHPALFDWATELSDAQGRVTLSEQEAHEIGARLRSMGEKLKAYEDLDGAASDVQLLRMGYAAARLEIETLQARIKTMAEERSDSAIKRYKIGYHTDEWGVRSSTPGGISDPAGQWVLYKDHLAALASHGQTPARADMQDAYVGAREDLAIWKRRALEAERDLRAERAARARLEGKP